MPPSQRHYWKIAFKDSYLILDFLLPEAVNGTTQPSVSQPTRIPAYPYNRKRQYKSDD